MGTSPPPPPAAPGGPWGSSQLESIFQAHHALVLRAAYRVTGSASDAEDVLQTIFLRLLRRSAELAVMENVPGYLHRAAVNAALDLVRARNESKNVPLESHESHLAAEAFRGPEGQQEASERQALLRRAISTLAPRAAEIFALHYFEGHASPEIANMLGLSTAGVAVTLHRTRSRLQKEIRSLLGESR